MSTRLGLSQHREKLVQLSKFGLVGGAGIAVNSSLLFLLHGVLALPLLLAAPLAFESAVVSNYLFNDFNDIWTFGAGSPSFKKLLKFNLVSLGALFVTMVVLQVLVNWAQWHYLIANLAGIGLGFLWNYSLNVLWTWRGATSRAQAELLNLANR